MRALDRVRSVEYLADGYAITRSQRATVQAARILAALGLSTGSVILRSRRLEGPARAPTAPGT